MAEGEAQTITRSGEEIAKPVFAGTIVGGRFNHLGEGLFGTAFPIGGSRLITAQHVTASAIATGGQLHIGWPNPRDRIVPGVAIPVAAANLVQQWPDVDLAAIEIGPVNYRALTWVTTQVPHVLAAVTAVGYPFGFDVDDGSLTLRAFSGTVSSSRISNLGRRGGPKTFIYELSFAAPRGLSGAALCDSAGAIVGCVVGNAMTRMLVFADEERLDDGGVKTRVERYEAMHLGIAIRSDAILGLTFRDGQSVREWIASHGGTFQSY